MKKQTTTTIFTFLGKNFKSSVMTEIFAYMAVQCRKTSLIFRERCCSCLKQEVIIEKMIYLFFERMCLCRFAKNHTHLLKNNIQTFFSLKWYMRLQSLNLIGNFSSWPQVMSSSMIQQDFFKHSEQIGLSISNVNCQFGNNFQQDDFD